VAAKLITGADIKDSTVTSADIKNGTLVTKDLKQNGVNGSRLQKGTVNGAKLKKGTVAGAKLKPDSVGSGKIKDGTIDQKDLNAALNALLPAKVTNLTGSLFTTTNPTVTMTPDGVNFGPYADGSAQGGSIVYNGLNGQPLNAVKNLVYYARYVADSAPSGDAPFLRVWTENDANDAIFNPETQTPDPDITQGPFHEWVATSGSWRYNDDAGSTPDESFADLLAAHGTETISRVTVTTGFAGASGGGINLQSVLRWMQINGKTFNFGS
jgi:hypothetical protein